MDTFPSSPPAAVRPDTVAMRAALDNSGFFQDPDDGHFYDQIAWFVDSNGESALTEPLRYEELAGNFDFRPALQGSLTTTQLSWRISDHYPLWASFTACTDRYNCIGPPVRAGIAAPTNAAVPCSLAFLVKKSGVTGTGWLSAGHCASGVGAVWQHDGVSIGTIRANCWPNCLLLGCLARR